MSSVTYEQAEAIKTLQGWANYLAAHKDLLGVSDKVRWQIYNAIKITNELVEEDDSE